MGTELKKYLNQLDSLIKKYNGALHGNDKKNKIQHLENIKARLQEEIAGIERYDKDTPFRMSIEKSIEERYDRECKNAEDYIESVVNPREEEDNPLLVDYREISDLSNVSVIPSNAYFSTESTYEAKPEPVYNIGKIAQRIDLIMTNQEYKNNYHMMLAIFNSIGNYNTVDERKIADSILEKIDYMWTNNLGLDDADVKVTELYNFISYSGNFYNFLTSQAKTFMGLINKNYVAGAIAGSSDYINNKMIELALTCLYGDGANVLCPDMLFSAIKLNKSAFLLQKMESDGAGAVLDTYINTFNDKATNALLINVFKNVDDKGNAKEDSYSYPTVLDAILNNNAALQNTIKNINASDIKYEVLSVLNHPNNNQQRDDIGAMTNIPEVAQLMATAFYDNSGGKLSYPNIAQDIAADAKVLPNIMAFINNHNNEKEIKDLINMANDPAGGFGASRAVVQNAINDNITYPNINNIKAGLNPALAWGGDNFDEEHSPMMNYPSKYESMLGGAIILGGSMCNIRVFIIVLMVTLLLIVFVTIYDKPNDMQKNDMISTCLN